MTPELTSPVAHFPTTPTGGLLNHDIFNPASLARKKAGHVSSVPKRKSGPVQVPQKTRRVGERCTLNLSRAQMSARWCGVVARKGGASSCVDLVT
ncbi:hypothetical protein TNCV_2634941 [Trichonephila clavipes]|nr:hypothetical protein TNCV_2634941 [Trichonephila clavipes]